MQFSKESPGRIYTEVDPKETLSQEAKETKAPSPKKPLTPPQDYPGTRKAKARTRAKTPSSINSSNKLPLITRIW